MDEIMQEQAKKRTIGRLFLVILVVVVLIAAAIIGIFYVALLGGTPQTEGSLAVAGLYAPVTVTRDAQGVPHIVAENEHDLFLAQGYVQAQDRLFQMDYRRRQASGRLSEAFGAHMLASDKLFRTLGLQRAAYISSTVYSQDAIAILKWYAEGVNAYINDNKNSMSIEFLVNGYMPEAWTPLDSIVIAKLWAYEQSGHWQTQAFRQYLMDNFPEEQALELFPAAAVAAWQNQGALEVALPDGTTPAEEGAPAARALPLTDEFLNEALRPDEQNGSNAWVLSGLKTVSGQPLLAADPHLAIASPAVWYQLHLQADGLNVSGVSMPGLPGVLMGHNDHIAWGMTNASVDAQNLAIELLNPENPRQYKEQDQWADLTVFTEEIRIKTGEIIQHEALETPRGPLLTDVTLKDEQSGDTATALRAYALQWPALDASVDIEGLLGMNLAKNRQEFEAAMAKLHAPVLNVVYTVDDGLIAMQTVGAIARRTVSASVLPDRGGDNSILKAGYVPFAELPRIENPESGYIATTNNQFVADGVHPYHLSFTWASPYRQQRVSYLLESKDKLDVSDMQQIQGDVLDLHAQEMLPLYRQLLGDLLLTERQQQALALLAAWDYTATADLAQPLIFELWSQYLGNELFDNALEPEGLALFTGRTAAVDTLVRRVAAGESSAWLGAADDVSVTVSTALNSALDRIEKMQGKDIAKWSWGAFHRVGFVHPLSSVEFLLPIFNHEGKQPMSGSADTVMVAQADTKGLVYHGAAWRFVYDGAQPTAAYHMLAPGNSEHALSPYYHGQIRPWLAGEQYQTPTADFQGSVLLLVPKAGGEPAQAQ